MIGTTIYVWVYAEIILNFVAVGGVLLLGVARLYELPVTNWLLNKSEAPITRFSVATARATRTRPVQIADDRR
jgi:hypothetical protein